MQATPFPFNLSRRSAPALALQLIGAAAVIGAVWALSNVILLLFLAVLLACILRGAAEWVASRTRLPTGLALALVVIALLSAAIGIAYWIGPKLESEGNDLVGRATLEWSALSHRLGLTKMGGAGGGPLDLHALVGRFAAPAESLVGLSIGAVADVLIVAVTTLYLASSPGLYVRGVLHLVPLRFRPRANEVMAHVGRVLQMWFLGQAIDMAVVMVLSGAGLLLVGVPVPYALAVLSGLLTFVPYIGPIFAAVPAVLVALTVSWPTAIWALGVYTLCHCVEGYVVAPLVQRRMVELPPALTVMAMTTAGTLFGVLGIVLGTPLVAACLVVVRMLYVEDKLGDSSMGAAE